MGRNRGSDDDKIRRKRIPSFPCFDSSPLYKGVLKSKGGGQLSIHFSADPGTIETFFFAQLFL